MIHSILTLNAAVLVCRAGDARVASELQPLPCQEARLCLFDGATSAECLTSHILPYGTKFNQSGPRSTMIFGAVDNCRGAMWTAAQSRSHFNSALNIVLQLENPTKMTIITHHAVTPNRPAYCKMVHIDQYTRPRLPAAVTTHYQELERRFCQCTATGDHIRLKTTPTPQTPLS